MSSDRWVVLGLAHPRANWFSELARWSTSAAIPVEFVKCVSVDEVRARFSAGRAYSALLIGGDLVSLDRDLVATAAAVGASVIVVEPATDRDWGELGVAAVLPEDFDRTDLLAALEEHAAPITRVPSLRVESPETPDTGWRAQLIAVTGSGGAGSSTVAMAIAQAFASEPSNHAMVLLADFALNADQAMLHDAREVVPGVQELTDAHRAGRLGTDEVRALAFDTGDRGYHLLLGLRRHRDWTALRPNSFGAGLEGLLRSYRLVVADVESDFEDESQTGSLDVQDRNLMARATVKHADLVVTVGRPTTQGVHSLGRTIRDLIGAEVAPERIVATFNYSPRNLRCRAEAAMSLAALLSADLLSNPVFLAERRDIETSVRDGLALPSAFARPLHRELVRRFDPQARVPPTASDDREPVLVKPGSIGSWTEATQ